MNLLLIVTQAMNLIVYINTLSTLPSHWQKAPQQCNHHHCAHLLTDHCRLKSNTKLSSRLLPANARNWLSLFQTDLA